MKVKIIALTAITLLFLMFCSESGTDPEPILSRAGGITPGQ